MGACTIVKVAGPQVSYCNYWCWTCKPGFRAGCEPCFSGRHKGRARLFIRQAARLRWRWIGKCIGASCHGRISLSVQDI